MDFQSSLFTFPLARGPRLHRVPCVALGCTRLRLLHNTTLGRTATSHARNRSRVVRRERPRGTIRIVRIATQTDGYAHALVESSTPVWKCPRVEALPTAKISSIGNLVWDIPKSILTVTVRQDRRTESTNLTIRRLEAECAKIVLANTRLIHPL